MQITDIRATTVTVPLEAPLRHSNGAHWGRFVRTVVEVDTDEGITGLGEMGGGGKLVYRDGTIEVPRGPGLGVILDRDKLGKYAQLYQSLGGYPYDRDPGRSGWYPLVPNEQFANPRNGAVPSLRG